MLNYSCWWVKKLMKHVGIPEKYIIFEKSFWRLIPVSSTWVSLVAASNGDLSIKPKYPRCDVQHETKKRISSSEILHTLHKDCFVGDITSIKYYF